jgi:transcriptional regulator with XRE-family HTH domain|tara:strand:+ start:18988 stop:19377 length:390 start_codon:yes stop_codon:yes gene_type:complete
MQELSDSNPYVVLGKRLKQHRIGTGMRAEKMAQDFGITWGTYQRIEAGLSELLDYLEAISTALNVPLEQLESLLSTETAVDKLKRVDAIEALLARSTKLLTASQRDVFRTSQIIDDTVATETTENSEYH